MRQWLGIGLVVGLLAWSVAGCGDDSGPSGLTDGGPDAARDGDTGDGDTGDGDTGDGGTGDAGPGGVGEGCTSPSDCREGLECIDDTCQPTGDAAEGEPCTLTGDCMDGLYCGPRRLCAPAGDGGDGAACTSTAECEAGLVCVVEGFYARCRPAGGGDIGDGCEGLTDCLAGLACAELVSGDECADPPASESDTLPPPLPSWSGAECPTDEGTAVSYFEVPRGDDSDKDFYRLPFPNDIRRTDTGLDLSGHPRPGTAAPVDVIGRYIDASEEDLDGFAINPVVYFRFSRQHDWGSVRDNVAIVNVDPDSSEFGQRHPAFAWLNTAGRVTKYICPNWLAVRPAHGVPLDPGTTYAVVLERGLIPDEGGEYARDEAFDTMLAGSAPSDATLADAWDDYAPLRQWLADADTETAASDVLNAAVFTTQEHETMVPALREAIRGEAAPTVSDLTVCDGSTTSPCDDGTEARACGDSSGSFTEIHGRIALPIFQQGTAPYETPDDGGGIATDGSGAPTVARTEDVCFALTVPKDATMPADGWPLSLHLHGTGGSFRTAVLGGLADDMATASAPTATLAFDLPQHGARRGDSDRPPEELFFNFANPRAARDNVMQGAADMMGLAYWIDGADIAAGDSPTGEALRFDAGTLSAFAHSQGATHAAIALPYEPVVHAIVLSGNGGDLTLSLLNKTEPIDIAGILPIALLDVNRDGELPAGDFHPALALFQGFFERVDPVGYARRLHREPVSGDPGRHVFMTYGLGDSYSPEPTMRAYARAARLTLVEPILTTNDDGSPDDLGLPTATAPLADNRGVGGSTWTIGMRQYEPATGEDGHFVATRTTDGRADVLRFLQLAVSGGTPTIGE